MKEKIRIYEMVGIPGVGKTYICNELLKEGFNVYKPIKKNIYRKILIILKLTIILFIKYPFFIIYLWLFFIRFIFLKKEMLNFLNKLFIINDLLFNKNSKKTYILDQFLLQYFSTIIYFKPKSTYIIHRIIYYYLKIFNIKFIFIKANNYNIIKDRLINRKKYYDIIILKTNNPINTIKKINNAKENFLIDHKVNFIKFEFNQIEKIKKYLNENI